MIFEAMLWLGVALSALPTVVFCLQVFVALSVRGSGNAEGVVVATEPPSTVILMPAHNEEKVLGSTLHSLRGLLPQVKVLVVADNCSDGTAEIARSAGVEVVERFSDTLRGKGYALQHGLEHLRSNPPKVVIVLDADCTTTPFDMHRLATVCAEVSRPVQGLYLMRSPLDGSIGTKIAEFAWLVKTMVRPIGWQYVGGTCQLMGSGFALPWHIARDLDLASGHLVEDMKLTLDLAASRQAPVFAGVAQVTSVFPSAVASQASQRRRWEHGHLSMMLSDVPRAVIKAAATRNPQLLSVALDLMVPPLSLLVLVLAGLTIGGVIQTATQGLGWSAVSVWVLSFSLGIAVFASWARWGRAVLTAREFMSIPAFVVRKLGVYGAFLWRRERQWRRTDRD
jgi:cellulose synthase/poly-beta-1,6-N-acetylglucosamine synthase-like glycosyltransferase